MTFYEKGPVRINYEVAGSGFPLLLHRRRGTELGDLRLARPLQFDRGVQGRVPLHRGGPAQRQYRSVHPGRWKSTGRGIPTPTTSSALMDHLGINKFMVMGFCIGGPFIWNLIKRAPDRVVAAVLAQPGRFPPGDADPPL